MSAFLKPSTDFGLLILRLGIGAMFVLHGLPKILGGPSGWEGLAQKGLPFVSEGFIAIALGLAAALAEIGGGILLALGYAHRIACLALGATMAVAFTTKLGDITGIMNFAYAAGWPLELLIVFVALFFTGPGRYRIGKQT